MKTLKTLIGAFDSLPEYNIEIGVFSGDAMRKETIRVGITNAELMFIHENGSPLHHIPARPVLKMTIEWANKELLKPTINRAIKAFLDSHFNQDELEKELNKMCIRMENYARDLIYSNDGRLAPNAPSTIAAKGFNHPLFKTSQLARSITCQLVKK